MNAIASANNRPDLARFLELKQAAEKRMTVPAASGTPSAPKVNGTGNALASSFAELLKAFRPAGSASVTAPALEKAIGAVEPKIAIRKTTTAAELAEVARGELQRRKTGLLSAYDKGTFQNSSDAEKQPMKSSIGIFFDAVA